MENFKKGDIVVYNDAIQEQVRWGNNDDPRGILLPGQTYKIEDIDVHKWHTKLTLHQISGRFNSVHFSRYDDEAI